MRSLPTAILDALDRGSHAIVGKMVHIDHPDGELWLWNGYNRFTWNGNEVKGVGLLGDVSGIKSSDDLEVTEVTLTISGIPEDAAKKVNDDVSGRTATVYEVLLDNDYRVIGEPIALAVVTLDRSSYALSDDGTAVLSLIGYSGFDFLTGIPGGSISREDLQADYAGDTGFDFVRDQAIKPIVGWGY